MERSRRGEGHENTSQSLTPVPEASVEDVSERENSELQTFPGYLTLELDMSDFQAFMPETEATSTQPDWELDGCQNPEVLSLDLPELFEPEESTPPGYLTFEIDLNALEDEALWSSSNNATSDEPRGKV
jgi:hypothetical protein